MPADWTLVAVDLRGRGYSNTLPRPYGMDQHVADVAAVLRHFAAQRPVLVGHSMGAYVALLTADAYPELTRKLVLLDGGLASPFPLPEGADPCGENGEFHTFVTDGPGFAHPLAVTVGETVERDGFVFTDVLPRW